MSVISSYYRLAKPGIVYGNSMHFVAAALFASAIHGFNVPSTIGGLIGMGLIIASACVVNCITDREIDAKMERTKKRPLPRGEVSVRGAVVYAVVLALVGAALIVWLSNLVVLACALACHLTYTVLYGYVKRHSWTSTIVGTIPGALPVLAGYAAVNPSLPFEAWLLTLLILVWQLPHFYGLAVFRRDDYAKSGLPLLSVVKPRAVVVQHIVVTVLLYVVAALLLVVYLPVAVRLAAVPVLAGALWWAWFVLFAKERGSDAWARKVFGKSLVLSLVFAASGVIAVAITSP